MELEQRSVEPAPKSPLFQVTSLSRYLAMALFVALPFIGGWVGYIYAPDKIIEVEKIILKDISDNNDSQYNKASEEDVLRCPSDIGLSSGRLDTAGWSPFYDDNFTTIHPAYITIGNIHSTSNETGERKSAFVIKDTRSGLSADVLVEDESDLEYSTIKFSTKYTAYFYEQNSKTLWGGYKDAEKFPTQCTLNDSNHNQKGNLVFVSSDGDAGFTKVDYTVILKPNPVHYPSPECNYSQKVLRIRFESDVNDTSHTSQETTEFEALLREIIQNIDYHYTKCLG